jgi:hypothetical protein
MDYNVRVVSTDNGSIRVLSMKDGEIAIITQWTHKEYEGTIVQRYQDGLVALGKPKLQSWPVLFIGTETLPTTLDGCKVKILPPGTIITL